LARTTLSLAIPTLTILLLFSISALSQTNADEAYLERQNDQGIVAYCIAQGFLEPDSEEFFHVGTVAIFGEVAPSPEAELHVQKGRDGISYLQGDEQSLEDLAAANDVDVKTVCKQYKSQVTLGRMMAKNKAGQ